MSKSSITVIVILVIIVIIGAVYFSSQGGTPSYSQSTEQVPTDTSTVQAPVATPTQIAVPTQTATSAATPAPVSVAISNFKFSPASITVKRGTTVTWTNNDSAAHTVTGDNGGPASANLAQGQSYSYTFTTAGS